MKVLLLISTIILLRCDSLEKKIEGTWYYLYSSANSESKGKVNLSNELEMTRYTFFDNGNFTADMVDYSESGSFHLFEKDSSLIINIGNSENQYLIFRLNRNNLVLRDLLTLNYLTFKRDDNVPSDGK